jgi:hypothetical protein
VCPVVRCTRLGCRSACAPQRAQAGWPRLPRPAKTERDSKNTKPGERAHRLSLGVYQGSGGKTAAMGASGAHRETHAKRRAGQQAHVTGWECRGSSQQGGGDATCSVCMGTCSPRAWQRSVRRRAGHAIPMKPPRRDLVCIRRRLPGCKRGHVIVPPVRPLLRTGVELASESVTAWSCDALRLLFACVARPLRPACGVWGCTSVAVAVASACGDKTSRRIGRRTGRLLGGEWGKDSGWGVGVAGRTSTGATCAISASKRGSSGAHASPLYVQCTLANTRAKPFGSSCSNTSYSVSPSA